MMDGLTRIADYKLGSVNSVLYLYKSSMSTLLGVGEVYYFIPKRLERYIKAPGHLSKYSILSVRLVNHVYVHGKCEVDSSVVSGALSDLPGLITVSDVCRV